MLKIRIPKTKQGVWLFVAHDPHLDHDLALITNVPLCPAKDANTVHPQSRYRPQLEHTYRFDQEDELDVEDIRAHTLERMRRIFTLVLMAASFVHYVADVWPHRRMLWLRRLVGKLGLSSDRDGPIYG